MSDTPRTDGFYDGPCKRADTLRQRGFARQLERELAAAIIERDNAISDHRQADTDSIRALHERNELREQLAAANKIITESLVAISSPIRSIHDIPERIAYLVSGLSAANARIAELENHLSPKPLIDEIVDERKEES